MAPYLYMLLWVYWLGFLAAAPIGPVNMVAIHRGVLGKWTHTLACGLGSVMMDLMYFALILWGGQQLSYLQNPHVQRIIAIAGALVLAPLGVLLLVKMFRMRLRDMVRSRRRMRSRPPRHLWTDVGTGIVLTVINPLTPGYWLLIGGQWISQAQIILGPGTMGVGLVGAAAGLTSWFLLLTFLVRFRPNRLGPAFFRTINGVCGVMLLIFALVCVGVAIGVHWWN